MLGTVALAVSFFVTQAQAFVFMTSATTGQPLRWPAPFKPEYSINPGMRGLSEAQVLEAFSNALSRWKHSGGTVIDFNVFQGPGVPASFAYDGHNAIFFQSRSSFKLSSGVLGATQTFFSGGTIKGFDIELNDEAFTFTTAPSDTTRNPGRKVFLENVLTHEIGHTLGLAHTGVMQGSMVWLEGQGQARLACDDALAVATAYPASGFESARGAISGKIKTAAGTEVFGAHVLAISKTRGTVVEGRLSDASGSFSITGLEPGDYYLAVEPFQGEDVLASLCQGGNCAFAEVNSHKVCGGAPFRRSFLESSPGAPRKLSVAAAAEVDVGDLLASCSPLAHPAALAGATSPDPVTTPTLISNSAGGEGAARGVIGSTGTSHYYWLENVSGQLSVKVVAFGLYAPWDPLVELLDENGALVGGALVRPDVFAGSSGFVNYDSTVELQIPTAGNYFIRLNNNSSLGNGTFTSARFPAGTDSMIDASRFYLLIATLNDSTPLLPSSLNPLLPNNARCESVDSFPPIEYTYVPGSTREVESAGPSQRTSTESAVGCGTIAGVGRGGPPSDGAGPGVGALTSIWSLAILLAMARLALRLASRSDAR